MRTNGCRPRVRREFQSSGKKLSMSKHGGEADSDGANAARVDGDRKEEKAGGEAVHLRREIGLLPAVSFIIGTVVGSGIFIAPKGVLMNSGSVGLSLLVWALCGVLSMFGETRLLIVCFLPLLL